MGEGRRKGSFVERGDIQGWRMEQCRKWSLRGRRGRKESWKEWRREL